MRAHLSSEASTVSKTSGQRSKRDACAALSERLDSAANVESCAPSHGAPTVRAPRAHTPRAHTPRAHARSDQDTPRRLRTLTETKSYRRSRGPRSCAAENSATCFARSNRIRAHGPGPAACVLIRRSGQQAPRFVID